MSLRLLAPLITALLALLTAHGPAQAASGGAAAGSDEAFSDIAGCISTADNVLVSLVVDESLSLRETDPDDLRVQGITTAIDSLQALSESLDGTRLHVSLSTFARTFDTVVGWRQLNAAGAGALRDAAESQLPDRDAGDATDYRQALQGARRELNQRQRSLGDPGACKVVLWFTDGALDVDEQTGAATSELCQQGGILDTMRRDGIAVVALALFTPGAGVSEAQREQLRSVAEGSGAGVTCGTVPIPPGSTTGIYLPADDPTALQELFGRAGALVGGGTEIETVTCPGASCPGGRYSVNIDQGVAGARVLVAGRDGLDPDISVESPGGEAVDLSSGSTEVDGATVTVVPRKGFATLDISYPRYAEEQAVWQVRPGPSELTVFWFWGAELDLETTSIQAGADSDLRIQLRDRAGDPLDPTLYDALKVSADLGNRSVRVRVTEDGVLSGTVSTDVDRLPPSLPLQVTVTARSRPSGTPLGPLSLTQGLDVELPPVYPALSPDELDFGELEGVGTAGAVLRATGSRIGPTRVCVTGSEVSVPGGSPADLVTAPRECVALERGGRGRIPLRLDIETGADGVAAGVVALTLEPADGSAPLEVEVPVELELQRVVDESTRWLLVALLVGLAALLPLLVLLLTNWLTATFAMSALSRVGMAPVRVTRSGLSPRDGGELITADHFDNAGFSGRRTERRMALGHTGLTAEARGVVGLRDAHGVASGPGRSLLVSAMAPYRGDEPHEAPMGLGDVDGTFVLLERNGTPEEADGTLVMVIPGSVDNEGIRERATEASNRVDWQRILAEAAGQGSDPDGPARAVPTGEATTTAAGETSRARPEADPEPFPWEDAADSRPTPAAPGRHSRGRRGQSASDSTPKTPDPKTGTDRPGDDDDLPPLPDFLREE